MKIKKGALDPFRANTHVSCIYNSPITAGESVTEVHAVPSTYVEMRENIERVLHFMSSKKIRMHHIQAKGEYMNRTNMHLITRSCC